MVGEIIKKVQSFIKKSFGIHINQIRIGQKNQCARMSLSIGDTIMVNAMFTEI